MQEIDLNNKCRACLTEADEMHYIFGEFDQGLTLSDVLTSTTSFEVMENDGLPPFLCEYCTTVVVEFYNFKTIYKGNEEYIKALLLSEENYSDTKDIEIIEETPKQTEDGVQNSVENPEHEQVDQNVLDNVKTDNESDCESDVTCLFDQHYMEEKDSAGEEITGEFVSPEELGMCVQNQESDGKKLNMNFSTMKPTKKEILTYSCGNCGDSFLHKVSFQKHMTAKHGLSNVNCEEYAVPVEIKEQKYEPYVDDTYTSVSYLNKCAICKKVFNSQAELKEHLVSHKKFICDQCGAAFLRKSYLDDHAEMHNSEKIHVCQYCGKAFQRRTVLVKHRRIHTHPRHYVCEICGKRFNDKGTMKTHIKLLHIGDRNFKCDLCGLTFPLKSTLEKHVRRHKPNREREFACHLCNMAYRDKSSLNRHFITKHTKDAPKASCEFCGKQYTTTTNLCKHRRKYHDTPIS